MREPATLLITSLNNQRVKDAIKLRDHRPRVKQGRFVIDGAREILRAIEGRIEFAEWFVCPELCTSGESREVLARLPEASGEVWHVVPGVFEKLAFGQRQEGIVAVAMTPQRTLADLRVAAGGLVAVLDGVEKPGNVGAMLRSADAAGVSAVIVTDPGTDLVNPNCIRASLGTLFTQQVVVATASETLAWLQGRGSKIFVARLDAEANYFDVDWSGDVAVVLGSEAEGVSAAWRGAEVTPIKLPMRGQADSLNVSATAAVLFYEALRQRGNS